MKNTAINLQDLFLNNARKERIPVTIFLMNKSCKFIAVFFICIYPPDN